MVSVRVETEEALAERGTFDIYARDLDIEDQVYIRDFDFTVPLARRALYEIHARALDQVCLRIPSYAASYT
jgi:hypothetical protein